MNKRVITIKGQQWTVGPELDNFVIYPTPTSSNSQLYAVDTIGKRLFVRFGNGGQYMYSNVPDKIIAHAPNVESISKFINHHIKPNPEIKTEKVMASYFSVLVTNQ